MIVLHLERFLLAVLPVRQARALFLLQYRVNHTRHVLPRDDEDVRYASQQRAEDGDAQLDGRLRRLDGSLVGGGALQRAEGVDPFPERWEQWCGDILQQRQRRRAHEGEEEMEERGSVLEPGDVLRVCLCVLRGG